MDNVHTLGFRLGGAELGSARILHVSWVPRDLEARWAPAAPLSGDPARPCRKGLPGKGAAGLINERHRVEYEATRVPFDDLGHAVSGAVVCRRRCAPVGGAAPEEAARY